jgi:hypothetical protein
VISKEAIIAEIRRTAEVNGGRPLGRGRFYSETGIKESDWQGRYWVRWSEAVAEAGFSPNRLTARQPDDAVLESLAALTLELGHVPLAAELRLRARRAPAFPSHNVFRRFGDKQGMTSRLAQYGRERGNALLVAICESFAGDLPYEDDRHAGPEIPVFGFVYLVRFGRHYKIGRTNALGHRERD